MPEADLAAITKGYGTFAAAKDKWLESQPLAAVPARGTSKRKRLQVSKLDRRLSIGFDFLSWQKGLDPVDSSQSGLPLSQYCKHKWTYDGAVPKSVKVWVRRCVDAAIEVRDHKRPWKVGPTLKRKKLGLVPREHRSRQYGLQGRPVMAPILREALFDWFLSVRSAVATRTPPKLALLKAKAIASEMLGEMGAHGAVHSTAQFRHGLVVPLEEGVRR